MRLLCFTLELGRKKACRDCRVQRHKLNFQTLYSTHIQYYYVRAIASVRNVYLLFHRLRFRFKTRYFML